MPEGRVDRRGFLAASASVAVAAVQLSPKPAQSHEIRGGEPWAPRQADVPHPNTASKLLFLTAAEAAFVEAASERLIPADDLGPGAKDCGVTFFIDHQLAGAFGRAQSWYMQGPWPKGGKTQGFQSRLAPAEMYRSAIAGLEKHVSASSGGKRFADLSPVQQDKVLADLEAGKLKLEKVDASTFFKMLWQNTKEGMFADPIYGGNKDMAGWKMLGFPGARYDYRDWVSRHGQRYDLPPVSIMGRPGWNENG
jgi:gluconate 2-dehydrogenase gamma chain